MSFDGQLGKICWRRDSLPTPVFLGFPGDSADTESTCNEGDPGQLHWRRDSLPTPVFLVFPGSSAGKESICSAGDLGLIPGLEDPLEEGMAIHSTILA